MRTSQPARAASLVVSTSSDSSADVAIVVIGPNAGRRASGRPSNALRLPACCGPRPRASGRSLPAALQPSPSASAHFRLFLRQTPNTRDQPQIIWAFCRPAQQAKPVAIECLRYTPRPHLLFPQKKQGDRVSARRARASSPRRAARGAPAAYGASGGLQAVRAARGGPADEAPLPAGGLEVLTQARERTCCRSALSDARRASASRRARHRRPRDVT